MFDIITLQETDAGLLTVISFPAFAVDDPELIETTRETVLEKLQVTCFAIKTLLS